MKTIFEDNDYRVEVDIERGLGRLTRGLRSQEVELRPTSDSVPKMFHDSISKAGIDLSQVLHIQGSHSIIRRAAAAMWNDAAAEWSKVEEKRSRDREENLERLFPGLNRLRSAIADRDRYNDEFSRMMNDEMNDGVRPPRGVCEEVATVARECPGAWAYLVAESFSFAGHFEKSAAGNRALSRLEAGEPYDKVIEEMESEWSAAATRCVENS